MWTIKEIESSKNSKKFCVLKNRSAIPNLSFLQLLRNEQTFRTFYNEYLANLPFDAFFWENKPVTKSNFDSTYECNVIDSDFLAQKTPDHQTFSSYFSKEKEVVRFPNLGNDAQLIAPCPPDENPGYAHIGTFVREAPKVQVQQLWKQTANAMMEQIGDEPKWLSTSGLGVFWLHIRIDSVPKYYQTREYKSVD